MSRVRKSAWRRPAGGDLVAEAVRDALDEAVDAEPPQVVGELPAGHGLGVKPQQGREVVAQVAVGETVGQQPEDAQRRQQGLHARAGERHPGGAGAGRADDGLGEGGRAAAPSAGSWLIRWTSSRRLLAVKPISFSSGR